MTPYQTVFPPTSCNTMNPEHYFQPEACHKIAYQTIPRSWPNSLHPISHTRFPANRQTEIYLRYFYYGATQINALTHYQYLDFCKSQTISCLDTVQTRHCPLRTRLKTYLTTCRLHSTMYGESEILAPKTCTVHHFHTSTNIAEENGNR